LEFSSKFTGSPGIAPGECLVEKATSKHGGSDLDLEKRGHSESCFQRVFFGKSKGRTRGLEEAGFGKKFTAAS